MSLLKTVDIDERNKKKTNKWKGVHGLGKLIMLKCPDYGVLLSVYLWLRA